MSTKRNQELAQWNLNHPTHRADGGISSFSVSTSITTSQPQGGDPRFYELLEEFKELHSRKNTDYSKGGKQGHLGNFIRVSEIKKLYPGLDLSSPLGTAIDYMLKQLDAALILYSTQRESVTGEGIEERLKDVAVYAILGILLRRDETTPVAAPVASGQRS